MNLYNKNVDVWIDRILYNNLIYTNEIQLGW